MSNLGDRRPIQGMPERLENRPAWDTAESRRGQELVVRTRARGKLDSDAAERPTLLQPESATRLSMAANH